MHTTITPKKIMPGKDRTTEWGALLQAERERRLGGAVPARAPRSARGQFAEDAAVITRQFKETAAKLERLTKRACPCLCGACACACTRVCVCVCVCAVRGQPTRAHTQAGRGAAVVKRKSLFDDRPDEIQQLTYIVKQHIDALNQGIGKQQREPVKE
jgi:hypothetical protein